MKLLVCSLIGCCMFISEMNAVQVIRTLRDPRAEAWSQCAENFGKSLGEGFNEAYRKRQAEQERVKAVKDQIFVMEILDNYVPERHQEFVTCVQRSDLPEDQKLLVVYQLNSKLRSH